MSIDKPLKVATPFTADTVVVPINVPGPPLVGVPVVIASVMEASLLFTILPLASSTFTVGCVAQATPGCAPLGGAVISSAVAPPELTTWAGLKATEVLVSWVVSPI